MTAEQERRVKIVTAAAVVVLVALLIALIGNIIAAGVLKGRQNRLRDEYGMLTGQNEQLSKEIEAKNSDIYAEQYLRDELGMVKPDEKVVIFK